MGRNWQSPTTNRDGQARFLSLGMDFVPYLHTGQHKGIQTKCPTLGGSIESITEPPLPPASEQRGHGNGGRVVSNNTCTMDVEGDHPQSPALKATTEVKDATFNKGMEGATTLFACTCPDYHNERVSAMEIHSSRTRPSAKSMWTTAPC